MDPLTVWKDMLATKPLIDLPPMQLPPTLIELNQALLANRDPQFTTGGNHNQIHVNYNMTGNQLPPEPPN